MSHVPDRLPRYDELPAGGGSEHVAWGLFGADDQVGMFNLQTPARIVEAARLVRRGAMFPLNWQLELPDPALYGRKVPQHTIIAFPPGGWGHDDWYDGFFPQGSSQWDALIHAGDGHGAFYNGVTAAQITGEPGTKNGVENWARRGIAGRCVLLDFARWYEREHGRPLAGDETYRISTAELDAVRQAQGVEFRSGDVLLLRTGWMAWYEQQDRAGRERFSDYANLKHAGLDASEEMARYLWDLGVCAAASDNTALEATPPPGGMQAPPGPAFLHYYLLGRLGIAIGELFYLEQLAADCARDGVYEAFFTSAPLNKLGGAGSPPNALAIK